MPRLERTRDQVLVTTGIDGVLSKSGTNSYDWPRKVRRMRHDPTLSFLRKLFLSPLMASDWTVESDGDEFKSAERDILDNFSRWQLPMMRNVFRGLYDFGWQAFETVWEYNPETGKMELRKMKPLLQDLTYILVDGYGEPRGVRNSPVYVNHMAPPTWDQNAPWIDLNHDESLIFSHDPEGTNWYGDAVMRAAELPYDSWNECEEAARRFDKKIAGAHWVVYYPEGFSRYGGEEEVDNFTIASKILAAMESSGKVAVPLKVVQTLNNLNDLGADKLAWRIELISVSSTSEGSFVGRQRYQDSLKCRAAGMPERAVTEGQYGTKADAEAHADFAIDNMEMFQKEALKTLNGWSVNWLLEMNHGKRFRDHVRLIASPLSDAKRALLIQLYTAYLNTQTGQSEEADRVDWPAIGDEIGVPSRQEFAEKPPGASPVASKPDGTPNEPPTPDDAAVAALGEYTGLGQRTWMNSLKRIRGILGEVADGSMSRVFAEEMLASIGVPQPRAEKLLDDAEAGTVDEPAEMAEPVVTGPTNGNGHAGTNGFVP